MAVSLTFCYLVIVQNNGVLHQGISSVALEMREEGFYQLSVLHSLTHFNQSSGVFLFVFPN